MQNTKPNPLLQICLERNISPYKYWQRELYRITALLQIHDKKTGFSASSRDGNYIKSFDALLNNPYNPLSPFTVTDILDDAWNCNLIGDIERELLTLYITDYHSNNPDNPNYIPIQED